MVAGTGTDIDKWVRRFHPAPAAPVRLISLPHAGGSASFLFPLSQALAPAVEVWTIQYPGRQDRRTERGFDSIEELADAIFAVLRPGLDKPTALFGHSMGAMLAYELAVRFEREAGTSPVHVFASGRRAPSCHRDENVHTRDDAGVLAELRKLAGTDPRVLGDDEIIQMIMPAVRSDYKAVETYRHRDRGPLSCPVTVLTGDSDPMITLDEAQAWAKHTTGPCEVKVLPGGHFFLVDQAPAVIREIRTRLAG